MGKKKLTSENIVFISYFK